MDTLFLNLKPMNTLHDLEEALKGRVAPLVKPLGSRLPHRRFTISLDITYQAYGLAKPASPRPYQISPLGHFEKTKKTPNFIQRY